MVVKVSGLTVREVHRDRVLPWDVVAKFDSRESLLLRAPIGDDRRRPSGGVVVDIRSVEVAGLGFFRSDDDIVHQEKISRMCEGVYDFISSEVNFPAVTRHAFYFYMPLLVA
ncbi:PH domain-containing protein [Corynebacterium variabile]|uniref:PH domain-containing protein n=1 Tax=Corynebacterium variabile TaxID=1727 RepID=UPI0035E3EEB6